MPFSTYIHGRRQGHATTTLGALVFALLTAPSWVPSSPF